MISRAGMIAVLIACISMQATAQEKKTLTLEQAVSLSLQNSHQLKNSQARIEEATAAWKEAKEKKLPSAGISGSYLRLNSPSVDLKNKNSSGNTSEPPHISQVMYGMANVSLPVFAGGKTRYGIESARFLEQAAKLDAESDREEVIQNTIGAFANLYKARAALDLVRENLEQARQRVKDLSNMEKNGLLARNDLLKAELQSSNAELSLLDAENEWQLANVNMNLLLGLPSETQLTPDTSGMTLKEDGRVLNDYVQLAVSNRKDRAALDYRKKAAESGVKVAKAGLYPSLQITGGYVAANIPGFLTITNAMNAGIGISYNLSSLWTTKSKKQQAEAKVKQLVASEALLDDHIQVEVNKSFMDLVKTTKKIDVYAKAVEQAEENDRIVKNKFNNSLATTTDLLDADVALLQARLNYTTAKADAFVAHTRLLQAAGILSNDFKN